MFLRRLCAFSAPESSLQYRPGRRPAQFAVVLGRAIGVRVFVARGVGPVVDVRHVVETERLVGELMDGCAADAVADSRDDLATRRRWRRVLDRVVREDQKSHGAPAAEWAEDMRLARRGERVPERRTSCRRADDRNAPERLAIVRDPYPEIRKRAFDISAGNRPNRGELR